MLVTIDSFSKFSWHFIVLILFGELSRASVTVEPLAMVAEIETAYSFSCSSTLSEAVLSWTLPNGEILSSGNYSIDRRVFNNDGRLELSKISLLDTGNYVCADGASSTASGYLHSYKLRSYAFELFVLAVLNIVFFVVFCIISLMNHFRRKQMSNLGTKLQIPLDI